MSLYEECLALTNGPCTSGADDTDSLSLIASAETTALHLTVPPFIDSERVEWMARCVYYISDLHLDYHVIQYLEKDASEERIRAYIHEIVMQLLDGEICDDIKAFKVPIVLFGGDISSSFALAEMFYRDFLSTWEQIADEQYRIHSKEFSSLDKEYNALKEKYDTATKSFEEWKEKHPWIKNAQKPLAEYSEKKVPGNIKELYSMISELKQAIYDKEDEFEDRDGLIADYERTRKHQYVYAILGNHELWDFCSYKDCVAAYSKLFEELTVYFLDDALYSLGPLDLPYLCDFNPGKGRFTYSLLKREDDPEKYDRQLFCMNNLLIVGGLGFAAQNTFFSAEQGIYGKAVNREEELKLCEEWLKTFNKSVEIAEQYHCSLVVLSHNPVSDWLPPSKTISNCFFFSGHTHRNIAYSGENNTVIFSDNQVGYSGKHFGFKKAKLYMPRNPFASDPDGYKEITCDEYREYYSYVCEPMPGTGNIEQQINKYEAKLYVLKQDGYVGFFLVAPRGVYICNGGQIRKIGPYEPLDRYMANFMTMVNKYIRALSPLRRVQEKLSAYIKRIGGDGDIHGTIVDIDFTNHVMVNVKDGTLTFYNSPMFGIVKTYSDIGTLLHAHCPELETEYLKIGNAQLMPISKSLSKTSSSYKVVDIKNSPYALSRRINALQRLFDKHILRDWNSNLEIQLLKK